VVKVHDLPPLFPWPVPASNMWVVTTVEGGANVLRELGYTVKFAGDLATAKQRGVSMIMEYNKILDLNESQQYVVHDFMR
jgi:hypothetical protein